MENIGQVSYFQRLYWFRTLGPIIADYFLIHFTPARHAAQSAVGQIGPAPLPAESHLCPTELALNHQQHLAQGSRKTLYYICITGCTTNV